MRRSLIPLSLASLLLLSGSSLRAGDRAWPFSRTRALTPFAKTLLADAAEQSPTVRKLLESFEETDLVVYVEVSIAPRKGDHRASLRFVGGEGPLRYVLVWVDAWESSHADRVAWLAHELQHAYEVAAEPEVRSQAALARYYRRIGHTRNPDGSWFETGAAKEAARQARADVAGFRASFR
ncbi:MAG: hypothetical protein ACE148_15060 [Vicinamibacterales bacterium]